MPGDSLLSIEDLRVEFHTRAGRVEAVRDISFTIDRGEVLAVVGESGCGKSVTALAVMGLVPPPGRLVAGGIRFDGRDLGRISRRQRQHLLGNEISMIFQDPVMSLNPVLTVGHQIGESLRRHRSLSRKAARARAVELLEMVGIPSPAERVDQHPHQFSGGMCQRVMIAIALACEPKLLIADEPTTALDVTVQMQILALLRDLQQELGMAVMLITHDLGVVAGTADRVNVMYAGRIVETGTAHDVFAAPSHPYTLGLLRSTPRVDVQRSRRLQPIPGIPPDLSSPPPGCAFEPRCPFAVERCVQADPGLEVVGRGHRKACWVDVASIHREAKETGHVV